MEVMVKVESGGLEEKEVYESSDFTSVEWLLGEWQQWISGQMAPGFDTGNVPQEASPK